MNALLGDGTKKKKKRDPRMKLKVSKTISFLCSTIFLLLLLWSCNVTYAQVPSCNGVLASDASVCSAHGFCIATDTCLCHDGYDLPNCATRGSGHVFSSGNNTYRQLGDPMFTSSTTTMIRVGDYFGLMRVEVISSGDGFSMALTTKGEVFAWGANNYGQLGLGFTSASEAIPSILRGDLQNKRIVSISACFYHALAADVDGNVYAWGTNNAIDRNTGGWLGVASGTNYYSPKKVNGPAAFKNVIKVRCGKYHSVSLGSDSTMFTWGGSLDGQLGSGVTSSSVPSPNRILKSYDDTAAPVIWVDIASGGRHNVALDEKGLVWTWGATDLGQTGNGDTAAITQTIPFLVTSVSSIIGVAASASSTYALNSDGQMYSWGSNSNGELGNSSIATLTVSPVLVTIMTSSNVKYVMSGFSATNVYAIVSDSTVYSWGNNADGQFGIGSVGTKYTSPKVISAPYLASAITMITPGSTHSMYLVDSSICFSLFQKDPLVCSGHGNCTSNDVCQCKSGYTGLDCSLPYCFGKNASDNMVCSGHGQCLTIDTCLCHQGYSGQNCEKKDEGFLYASGDNSFGQLADNLGRTGVSRMIPVSASAFAGVHINSVASGMSYSLILLVNGTLFSVGKNDYGQLGDGSTTPRSSPVKVEGSFNGPIVTMCAGLTHSLVVDETGSVWSFGDNSYGQLGTGNTAQTSTPVKIGGALTGERVVSVACGSYHSVALLNNGTVLAWGRNHFGQLGDGTTAQKTLPQTVLLTGLFYKRRVAAIAAGGSFTMVIADDGTLYRWGENSFGQLGDGTLNTATRAIALNTGVLASKKVTGIAASSYSSHVIADGLLYSSGYNLNGQLGIGSTTNALSFQKVAVPHSNKIVSRIFAAVCNSQTHVSAISDSLAYVWGNNNFGQLGDGTNIQRTSPVNYHIYFPDRQVLSMAVGCVHTLIVYDLAKSCYGVLADEPSVCSYHGNCSTFDQCLCEEGYSGLNCDYFECHGIARDNSSVCSGRGVCSGVDVCLCNPGYSGSNCEKEVRGIAYSIGQQSNGVLANDDVPSVGYSQIPLLVGGLLTKVIVTKVDGGNYFSIALSQVGDLYSWGSINNNNNNDRPQKISSNVLDCCAGVGRVVAIKKDGTVQTWGSYGLTTSPLFDTGEIPKSVACGAYHTLILTNLGTVYSFGYGTTGQLGVGSTSSLAIAQKVLGLTNIAQVAAGDYHSLALGEYGEVYSWGRNNMGQLADTTLTDKTAPVLATGAITTELIVHISASVQSSFAVTNKGQVYSWGSNTNGILGDSSAGTSRPLPGLVKNIDDVHFKALYPSKSTSWVTGINETSGGYSWGINTFSQLGDKSTTTRLQPVKQVVNENYPSTYLVGVGAGSTHSLLLFNGTMCYGILADDELVCNWRGTCVDEDRCACDSGYYGNECELTTCFDIPSNSSTVCSGNGTCVALDTCSCIDSFIGSNCEKAVMGYIYGAGKNSDGQLGDDLQIDRSILVTTSLPLSTDKYVKFLSAGLDFSLAITREGELYTWGSDFYYYGSDKGFGRIQQIRPILRSNLKFVSGSAAQYHAVAVTDDGKVYSWGCNTLSCDTDYDYQQRRINIYGNYEYIPQTAKCTETQCCVDSVSVVCTSNPTILGYLGLGPSYFFSATPREVTGMTGTAISVSCGLYHCLVLMSSGAVWAWGDNTYGQLGNGGFGTNVRSFSPERVAPSLTSGGTLSDVKIIAISAGSYHSMALSSMGEVFVWGSNANGQIGDDLVRSPNLSRFPKKIVSSPLYRIPIKSISAGTFSSFVIGSNNSVFAWGSNTNYQLGINSTVTQTSNPVALNNQMPINAMSSSRFGSDFVIAGDLDGNGFGWGLGSNYQLLNGVTDKIISPQPTLKLYANPVTQTYTNRSIVAVAAGTQHSLFLLNGTFCFGLFSDDPFVCSWRGECVATDTCICQPDYFGRDCGLTTCFGVNSTDSTVCSGFGACVSHDSCSCATGYTGKNCSVWLFGESYSIGANSDGQLGDDYYLDQSTLTRTSYPLSYGEHVQLIEAGVDFTVAVSRTNKLFVWGKNSFYNLGTGTTTDSLRPFQLLSDRSIVSACAGKYHGVAVDSLGNVFSWGSNTQDGRVTCPLGSPASTSYCSETSCSCNPYTYPPIIGYLGLGGSYYFSATPKQVSLSAQIVSVSCGASHTIALSSSGKLYAWGEGSNGQLGIGNWLYSVSPVVVAASSPIRDIFSNVRVVQVSTGLYHSIALGSKGDVYTWGDNSKGQLGHGTTTDSRHPIQVFTTVLGLPVIQVVAGDNSSYVLTSDSQIYSWGDNSVGQLGIDSTVSFVSIPTHVSSLAGASIVSIATSSRTVIAIASNGTAYSWGLNTNSQANDGSITSKRAPTLVVNPYPTRKIVAATTGNIFSVLVLNTTYCFGYPMDDVMACSTRGNCTDTDTCVCANNYFGNTCQFTTCFGLNNTNLDVCSGHGSCIDHDTCQCSIGFTGKHCDQPVFGSLRTIGNNNYGQLGDDYTIARTELTKTYQSLADGTLVQLISSGVDASFGITVTGELFSWGYGTSKLFPSRILSSKQVVSVCRGSYHNAAVTSSGEVYSWGVNTMDGTTNTASIIAGQLGIGSSKYSYSPTIVSGLLGTPITVACGHVHTLVLTKEGYVFGFGDDETYGAVGYGLVRKETIPVRVGASSPIKGILSEVKIVAIAAGQYHSMALGIRGEVYTWGDNSKGQLGDASTLNNRHPRQVMNQLFGKSVIQIAAGTRSSYAIASDGTLFSWGENDAGQLGINSTINQNIPTVVQGVEEVMSISAGTWSKYALVVTRNGTAFGFGDNTFNKIGDGTSISRLSPSQVLNPYESSFFVAAEASSSHSMFLLNGTFCFGILSADESVCSTRGTCVSTDHCICEEEYLGVDCSINVCFGLNQSDSNVCSGHGSCVARDTCACQIYFTGRECEMSIYGLLYSVGDNSKGQLGDDYYDAKLIAAPTAAPLTHWKYVKHATSGVDISLGLSVDGELFSWGKGSVWSYSNVIVGLLGDGTLMNRNRPEKILSNIIHMCVSTYHVAAVDDNNVIYTWGVNTFGVLSCTNTTGSKTVVLPLGKTICPCISPGACPTRSGVLGNSSFYWSNNPVMVTPPADNYSGGKVVELACGSQHTLARTSNGFVYGWGQNNNAQLGDKSFYGSYLNSPKLLQVNTAIGEPLGDKKVISIAAGDQFSMVLTDRGKVFVWGDNSLGQVADGTTNIANTFHARLIKGVFSKIAVTKIASGKQSAYATTEDGKLFSWGDNSNGQLGINSTVDLFTIPMQVNGLTNVSFISSSIWSNSVEATTQDGVSFAWGDNTRKHLGLDMNVVTAYSPRPLVRFQDQTSFVVSFGVGNAHTLMIYNGTYCDGVLADDPSVCSFRGICVSDNFCVCNNHYTGSNCSIAQCYGTWSDNALVCSGHGRCIFNDVCLCDAGYFGAMCNNNDRQFLYASGDDSSSQLGDGFFVSQNYPRQASLLALTDINYISAGDGSSFAVSLTEGVFAFGNNDYGQLGDNTTFTRYFPVSILEGKSIINLVACVGYSLAIDFDNNVYAWGINTFGQLGTGNTQQYISPVNITQHFGSEVIIDIACGQAHTLALSSKGKVFSWGRNGDGELGRGFTSAFETAPSLIQGSLNNKNIIAIAAGIYHSLALNRDGAVYSWGKNTMGQLGDGYTYSRIVPFAVKCNDFGPEPVISIGAGIDSSYALLKNGTAYSWGSNIPNRQLGDNSIVINRKYPAQIPFETDYPITSIAIGKNSNYVLALASNGTAYGWGVNNDGQLGDYTFVSRNFSSAVGNTKPQRYITSMSAGKKHSLFLFSGISCFGIVFDDPTVCSWRGNCTALDHCECPPSYGGRDCSVAQCYNVNATDSNVCSGGGRCVSLDTCVCFQGYAGKRCEIAPLGYLYSSGQDSYSQLGSRGVGFRPTVERATLFFNRLINLVVPAYEYSLLKTVSGEIYSWGKNNRGQLGDNSTFSKGIQQHILGGSNIIGLCGGVSHAMALEANGQVFAWGSNQYGQIGINSPQDLQLTPTRVTGELLTEDIVAIACGGYHSMALSFNGSVYTWGFNLDGELGDNSFILKYTPIKVAALLKNKRIVQITAGKYHSMALGSDGTVYSWGKNDKGQLGDSTKTNKFLPVQVPGLLYGKPVSQITAGDSFSMVMAFDGSLYSWGANNAGQLGDGTTVGKQIPTRVTVIPDDIRVLTISAGGSFVHALLDNQTAIAWGDNMYGQLGDGSYNSTTMSAVQVQKQYQSIYPTASVAGDNFSIYLFNGTTCFGKFADDPTVCSTKGSCIDQDKCICDFPYNAPDCSSFHCFGYYPNDTLTCSGRGSCLAADACVCRPGYIGTNCERVVNGFAFTLGEGSSGQMGDGYTFSHKLPVPVTGDLFGRVVSHVDSGNDFSIAITPSGQVFGWGLNNYGQLGDGTTTTRLTPVSPLGMSSVNAVTGCTGYSHTVIVDSDGRVFTWGRNNRGQLGNGDSNDNHSPIQVAGEIAGRKVVQAVCGEAHTAVLIDDGSIFAWGSNSNGQLGNGDNWPLSTPTQVGLGILDQIPISKIASGWNHMMGIGSFGVIYIWGSNSFGQLGDGAIFNRYSPIPVLNSQFKGKTAISVEGSEENTYAVFSDGSTFAWGGASQGQIGDGVTNILGRRLPVPILDPRVDKKTTSIFAGRNYVFALTMNGTAYSWGFNLQGQQGNSGTVSSSSPVPVVNEYPIRSIVHIAPSLQHTVFLYNGTSCFGFLADDENTCSSRGLCTNDDVCACEEQFSAEDCSELFCNGVSNTDLMVCSGNGVCIPNNTCVCHPNFRGQNCNETRFGYLYGTGDGTSGQLGNGGVSSTNFFIKAKAASLNTIPIQFVGAGNLFSVALTVDGKLYSVGINTQGQLGDGTLSGKSSPVLSLYSQQNLTVSNVAVGYSSVVVSTKNGSLYTWGNNQQGQLGLGYQSTSQNSPVIISSLNTTRVSFASCGSTHCLALTAHGEVYSWGGNLFGQLGDGTLDNIKSKLMPIRVMSIFSIKKAVCVFVGAYHSLATTVDGVLYGWGDDSKCQLGQGVSTSLSSVPVKVKGLESESIEKMSGGEDFSCALTSKKQVWCWGANDKGQLGINTTDAQCLPNLLTFLSSYTIVEIASSGYGSSFALTDTGKVLAWGSNYIGQLGDYSKTNKLVPEITASNFTQRYTEFFSLGFTHSLALFNGKTCFNVLQDDPDVCSGNGTCTDWDTCVCKSGFSGTNCEFTSCFGFNMTDTANVCSGRGECKYLNTCICDPNKWSGDRCQYINCFGRPSNDPAVCSSHGQCIGPGVCNCTRGYNGNNCQFTICHSRNTNDSLVCSGKGVCIDPDVCMCYSIPIPGYTGGNCSYPVCYSRYFDRITGIETIYQAPATSVDLVLSTSKDCSGHGRCLTPSKCNCTTGYTDPYCSTPICFGLNATNPASCNYGKNGTCVSPNNCTCLTKFDADGFCVPLTCYGKNLTTVPPSCNSHLGHGNCINIDFCVCTRGYGGLECEQNVCNGILEYNHTNVCHGRGYCQQPDQCLCQRGYNGTDCQYIDCYGRLDVDHYVCSGHGVCHSPNECVCDSGFAGNECQYPICYGKLSNDTVNVCSNHGKCTSPDNCECSYGYSGLECYYPSCFEVNTTAPEVCSTHGSCYKPDKCNCTDGWVSRDCSVPLCYDVWGTNRSVCSKYGFCYEPDICLCSEGRIGLNCELNYCFGFNETDELVCNSHGKCIGPHKCNCSFNQWTGFDCNIPICFGTPASNNQEVCSGRGSCIFTDTCQCDFGRTGTECKWNICFGKNQTDPMVCSGHGICYSVDTNRCNCSYGWKGSDCSDPVCFGIPYDHRDTCSGVGTCVSADTCNCSRTFGRTGIECQLSMCYGINETDSSVCSSNGTCVGVDKCKCSEGRTGHECQLNICYLKNESDPLVCSGNGHCIAPDTCVCFPEKEHTTSTCSCVPEYSGTNCSIPICFGIPASNDSVCNGAGSCVDPNRCSCNNGYNGDRCQLVQCYGRLSNESNVCSGFGSCIQPNTCRCVDGYVSDICNIPICNQIFGNNTNVCSGRGSCIAPEKCLCLAGFAGSDCEIVRSQCDTSSEFLLVSLPDGPSQNISLVDLNCGRAMYSFRTLNSSGTFYSKFSKSFYLLREDGIYTVNSEALTLLRPLPDQKIENMNMSAVFVNANSMIVVSLESEIRIHSVSLFGKSGDKVFSTTLYTPLTGGSNNRFTTIDTTTGNIYLLARKRTTEKVVILQVTSSGVLSELIVFKSFPSIVDVQALMYVDGSVHLLRRTYLSRISGDKLSLVTDLAGGFFADVKYESNSHVYLNDLKKRLIMIVPKNKAFDASPSVYPRDLNDKFFTIIGNWEPLIDSLSPSGIPADSMLSSWIRLGGQHLTLDGQSKISLIDPISDVKVTTNLVACSSIGLTGDACFKPSFKWPSDRGSVEFTDLLIYSVSNSTGVPQKGLSLVYFQPSIISISPTTAKQGDIISLYAPWFSQEKNITCTFLWKKLNGEEETIDVMSTNIDKRHVECPVPLFEGANNNVVQVTVTMMNREFSSQDTPAFFYYIDTSLLTFYDSFDHNSFYDTFESILPSQDDITAEWIPFDEVSSRSISRLTSYLSDSHTRAMFRSKSPLVKTLDQQLVVEFIIDPGQTGNLLELWYTSELDHTYNAFASITVDAAGSQTISSSYQLGDRVFTSRVRCPSFTMGVPHSLTLKLVRPEVEMLNMNETLFYEWLSIQNVSSNASSPLPDEPWRIDASVKQGYSQICQVSANTERPQVEIFKKMLSTGHLAIAQSLIQQDSRHLQQNTMTLTASIDRVWVTCQYSECNITNIPKNMAPLPPTPVDQVKQYTKGVVVAVSSIAGSLFFLLFFALLIPVIIFILWRLLSAKRKKEMQAKLDAWKFEFVLDKNVTSLEDDQFASVARKMYKVDDGEDNRIKAMFSRKYARQAEIEMSDVTEFTADLPTSDSNSEMELIGSPSTSALNALRAAKKARHFI